MKQIVIALIALFFVLNSASAQENRAFKKGYAGSLELSEMTAFGKDMYGGMLQASTTQGYRTGTGAFVGMGVGILYDMSLSGVAASTYLDGKYHFIDRAVSPFASFRMGVRFGNGPTLFEFIDVAGGVDFSCFSVRLGFERNASIVNHTSLGKGNALFCSFAIAF